MSFKYYIAGIMTAAALASTSAFAQDIAEGEKVFKKCAACHNATETKNKIGPHLVGILDRPAGSIEDFKYSKGMMEAAEGGLVWTPEEIAIYLVKPKDKIKGTKMSFAGLKNEDDIANVIAYMAEQKAQ